MDAGTKPTDVLTRFQLGEITEEDYLDAVVKEIVQAKGADAFLDCLYENLYDHTQDLNKVAAYTREELRQSLHLLREDCSWHHSEEIQAYLDQLDQLLDTLQEAILVRWALAKLIGIAVTRANQ